MRPMSFNANSTISSMKDVAPSAFTTGLGRSHVIWLVDSRSALMAFTCSIIDLITAFKLAPNSLAPVLFAQTVLAHGWPVALAFPFGGALDRLAILHL